MSEPSSKAAAEAVFTAAKRAKAKLALAESCTGGLVSKLLTDLPGSSAVVDSGFVTYSNEAKAVMLGLDPTEIAREGAVSEATARAMAEGAIARSAADFAVGITGIAGPSGGSREKPVGLVHFATAVRGGKTKCERVVFEGSREEVREAAAKHALEMLLARLDTPDG
jgi:nicotinamide-nucleotide amidase